MKFLPVSDLHLEHHPDYLIAPMEGEADINLILAGDICEIQKQKKMMKFIEDACARFKNVIHVPGNHEFWNGHLLTSKEKIFGMTQHLPNYHFLSNKAIKIDDVNIIGSILWTDFDKGSPLVMLNAQSQMKDYKKIRHSNYQRIKARDIYAEYIKCVEFINKCLFNMKGEKNIVVTHHAPTRLSIADEYVNDNLNGAYVSDLSEMMYGYSPNFWIHGHVHQSFDYMMYDTRVICNPRGFDYGTHPVGGYRINPQNPHYSDSLVYEI